MGKEQETAERQGTVKEERTELLYNSVILDTYTLTGSRSSRFRTAERRGDVKGRFAEIRQVQLRDTVGWKMPVYGRCRGG